MNDESDEFWEVEVMNGSHHSSVMNKIHRNLGACNLRFGLQVTTAAASQNGDIAEEGKRKNIRMDVLNA